MMSAELTAYLIVVPLFFFVLVVFLLLRIEVFRLSNAEALAGIVEQLGKARDEILGKIASLEAAAGAGEDLSGVLAELAAAAQALDDVVPDEVVAAVEAEEAVEAPVDEGVTGPVEEAPAAE